MDIKSYVVTDPFFGPPYIDVDDERDTPVPHRYIHGGFEGTDTRFSFYFPPKEQYHGRMFNPLSGANGGTEHFFGSPFGSALSGLDAAIRLGGYMVESNQGHIGDEIDPKGGNDITLYGHRASAEVARFSKHVSAEVYGSPPHHSYVYGGSGGGRRSPTCIENAPGVWDGCLPFMGGGNVTHDEGKRQGFPGFPTMFNVQRLLGSRIADVIDAMAPGGSGNPYAALNSHERDELVSLYRQGYPRGDEFMIAQPMGQSWMWTAFADRFYAQDPSYFENFWTKPGYVGHDQPEAVLGDLIDVRLTVTRVLSAQDILDDPQFATPEHASFLGMVGLLADATATGRTLPVAVEVPGIGQGFRLGTGVCVVTGKGAGRQLYCMSHAGDVLFCDAGGVTSNERFTDVLPGDEVHVDNHRYLAYCYWTRHHIADDPLFDSFRADGVPIYPQHEPDPDQEQAAPFMGMPYSGQYQGKVLWVHHTHDASLWPPHGTTYERAVRLSQGPEGLAENFRLRWTENAEHIPPEAIPSPPGRATNTWLIDYSPVIEQSLQDLADWVERGIVPASTSYSYRDGKITLPDTAAERGGIQPVVSLTANGATRVEVRAGERVTLEATAEVPPGAGTVIAVEWDFDGTGTFPESQAGIDGTAAAITATTTHTYDRPGTYFATARVLSHRDGDVKATSRRVPNLAQARVIVT